MRGRVGTLLTLAETARKATHLLEKRDGTHVVCQPTRGMDPVPCRIDADSTLRPAACDIIPTSDTGARLRHADGP